VSIQVAPGRLDDLKLPIILVLVVGFAGFAVLLARKPVVAVAGAPPTATPESVTPATSSANIPPAQPSAASAPNLAAVDAAVGSSLDALKDTLFRLELRRQAGTISEADYATERARAEKVLRDLVRG